ncbi:DUF6572 domain-containing protein [Roseovarius sp. S88]|uniref:DUF6572 domain-containing protein n=1 Tax=Roseovarius phycicola TaxID=3080976 RepID=A0ABZ2HN60_9RHOB
MDFISLKSERNEVVLTISDHLGWKENVNDHLLQLQEKLNTYIRFVESEEILKSYPDAEGRKIVFNVLGKHPLPKEAEQFYVECSQVLRELNIDLTFENVIEK